MLTHNAKSILEMKGSQTVRKRVSQHKGRKKTNTKGQPFARGWSVSVDSQKPPCSMLRSKANYKHKDKKIR